MGRIDQKKWSRIRRAKRHDEVMAGSTSIIITGKSRATRILVYPLKVFKILRRIFLQKEDKKGCISSEMQPFRS